MVEVDTNIKTLTISKHYDGYTGTSRIATLEDDEQFKGQIDKHEHINGKQKKHKKDKSTLNTADTDGQLETFPED